jgi:N-acetylmuramoyl-L-alanine amidase
MKRNSIHNTILGCGLAAGLLLFSEPVYSSDCAALYKKVADAYYGLKNRSGLTTEKCRALMDSFRTVAELYPDCHKADDALFMVGVLGMQAYKGGGDKNDLADALASFNKLAGSYPQSTLADDAQYYCGEIHALLGERDKAVEAYKKTLDFRGGDMSKKAVERMRELANAPAPETNEKTEPGPPASADKSAGKKTGGQKRPNPEPSTIEKTAKSPAGKINDLSDEEILALSFGITGRPAPAAGSTRDQPVRGRREDVEPLPLSPAPADYARLLNIRYWSNKDYTRVVVDLDREAPFAPPHLLRPDPELGTPPRLYIDFQGAVISESMRQGTPEPGCYTMPIGDGLLKKARAGQYQPDVARVVLDIERIDRFNAFPLPGERFRYVIDVYGSHRNLAASRTAAEEEKETVADKAAGSETKKVQTEDKKRVAGRKKIIIVLDPGHGGRDPGAVGPTGLREKDVTLSMARRIKRVLEAGNKDVRVVLTRSDDRYLSLVERTAMANTMSADLFVSIHCNAAASSDAYGIETYYLDNTTDRAALKLAAKENFVAEEVMTGPRDTTNLILADLITMSKVEDSVPLARSLQKHLISRMRKRWKDTRDKGVKKAPFWVLTGATMPCALVEVSFISNRKEEKLLRSSDYQQAAASAIASGVLDYIRENPEVVMAK